MKSAGGDGKAGQGMALGAGLVAPRIGLCSLEGTRKRGAAIPVPKCRWSTLRGGGRLTLFLHARCWDTSRSWRSGHGAYFLPRWPFHREGPSQGAQSCPLGHSSLSCSSLFSPPPLCPLYGLVMCRFHCSPDIAGCRHGDHLGSRNCGPDSPCH